jgi:hypothetical protein
VWDSRLQFPRHVYLYTLMMEVAGTSEALVNFYHTERRDIPGDSNLHSHRQVIFQSRLTNCRVAAARIEDDNMFFIFLCFYMFQVVFT